LLAVRTSAEIKAEIQAKFGFVPPFFGPAEQSPQVFENLWQQTLLAYVSNPLTPLFKEKLSAYLSRYCAVPYCMVCHSCSLRPLGMEAKEVLELLESPPPTELEIDKHLKQLAAYSGKLTVLPEPHSPLEESLLACSIFIALEQEQAEGCRVELRRILGPETYQHLVSFSAYIKTCHAWMEAHPEVAYEADQRVLDHLSALLTEAPELQTFFDTYVDRIRQERRQWSERLAVLREKKRNEQRFRFLTEAIPQQVWTAQPDGQLDYVNQRILDYFGCTAEEIIGRGWQAVIHPEDLSPCLVRWQAALTTGQTYEIEFRLKNGTGEYRWHLARALPLWDEQGQISSWFGTNTDIHDRKQAQEERDRFFSLSPDMLCIASMDGFFKSLNPSWQKTLGYTEQELLAQPFLNWVHPQDRDLTLAELQKLSQGGETREFENRYRCQDGSYRWLLWNAAPLVEKSIFYAVAHDITDRKQAEAEIQQLNETLEQRVKQRTAQLEAANQELDSFSYSVSHDLRAPLRHISGFVAALQQRLEQTHSSTDPKITHYLEVIHNSSQKMGQLIDGLLTLSRLGRRQLTSYPVELGQLVETAVNHTQSLTDVSAPTLLEFQVGSLPPVMGDATLLQQVFSNLIDNAVKFSRHSHPATIKIGSLADGTIFVQDNGVGFDMEHADQLFGPFQRLHSQQEFEGTGIGLAIVQRIIHLHGGTIWAKSQPGQGATFYLKLRPVTPGSDSRGC
jgi:PAS domain S-box-containing protein